MINLAEVELDKEVAPQITQNQLLLKLATVQLIALKMKYEISFKKSRLKISVTILMEFFLLSVYQFNMQHLRLSMI